MTLLRKELCDDCKLIMPLSNGYYTLAILNLILQLRIAKYRILLLENDTKA